MSIKRWILVLLVLVGGIVLTGCSSSSYSKREDKVFRELDKLSRSIPKGYKKDDNSRENRISHHYRAPDSLITEPKYISIEYVNDIERYKRYLIVCCLYFDKNILNLSPEDRQDAYIDLGKKNFTSSILFNYTQLTSDAETVQITWTFLKTCTIPKLKEGVTIHQKGDVWGGIDGVSYWRKKGDVFWNMLTDIKSDYPDLLKKQGKMVSQKEVQRYIDLVDRFIKAYSLLDR